MGLRRECASECVNDRADPRIPFSFPCHESDKAVVATAAAAATTIKPHSRMTYRHGVGVREGEASADKVLLGGLSRLVHDLDNARFKLGNDGGVVLCHAVLARQALYLRKRR